MGLRTGVSGGISSTKPAGIPQGQLVTLEGEGIEMMGRNAKNPVDCNRFGVVGLAVNGDCIFGNNGRGADGILVQKAF